MTKDYSKLRDPEFAESFDRFIEMQMEHYKEIDKMFREIEEAQEQLDLFKEYAVDSARLGPKV
jgi:rubrerythrin